MKRKRDSRSHPSIDMIGCCEMLWTITLHRMKWNVVGRHWVVGDRLRSHDRHITISQRPSRLCISAASTRNTCTASTVDSDRGGEIVASCPVDAHEPEKFSSRISISCFRKLHNQLRPYHILKNSLPQDGAPQNPHLATSS